MPTPTVRVLLARSGYLDSPLKESHGYITFMDSFRFLFRIIPCIKEDF